MYSLSKCIWATIDARMPVCATQYCLCFQACLNSNSVQGRRETTLPSINNIVFRVNLRRNRHWRLLAVGMSQHNSLLRASVRLAHSKLRTNSRVVEKANGPTTLMSSSQSRPRNNDTILLREVEGYDITEGERQTKAMLYYSRRGILKYKTLSLHTRTGSPQMHAPPQHLEHDRDDAAREHANPAVDEDLRQHYIDTTEQSAAQTGTNKHSPSAS